MKTLTRHLAFTIPTRMGFENITSTVADLVTESGIQEGLCLVNAMHITASVFINDDEAGLHNDYKKWLEELAPFDASPEGLRSQSNWRRQRRRAHETTGHGEGSCCCYNERRD